MARTGQHLNCIGTLQITSMAIWYRKRTENISPRNRHYTAITEAYLTLDYMYDVVNYLASVKKKLLTTYWNARLKAWSHSVLQIEGIVICWGQWLLLNPGDMAWEIHSINDETKNAIWAPQYSKNLTKVRWLLELCNALKCVVPN